MAAGSTLPWAGALQEALGQLYRTLRSPIEYESTPVITQLMQVLRALQPCRASSSAALNASC